MTQVIPQPPAVISPTQVVPQPQAVIAPTQVVPQPPAAILPTQMQTVAQPLPVQLATQPPNTGLLTNQLPATIPTFSNQYTCQYCASLVTGNVCANCTYNNKFDHCEICSSMKQHIYLVCKDCKTFAGGPAQGTCDSCGKDTLKVCTDCRKGALKIIDK
jgi:hypothetical protein